VRLLLAGTKRMSDFERDDDFSALMSGAHRKPPVEIGAPSLTQHRAFWIPAGIASREKWVLSIEKFVLALFDRITVYPPDEEVRYPISPNLQIRSGTADDGGPKNQQCIYLLDNFYPADKRTRSENADACKPEQIGVYPNRYQTVRFEFLWESMHVEISVELHAEYFTLSATVDLSLSEPSGNTPEIKAVNSFINLTGRRYESFSATEDEISGELDENELRKLYDAIYKDVWDRFFRQLFSDIQSEFGQDVLGGVFADFRGFILCRDMEGLFVPVGAMANLKNRIAITRAFDTKENEDVHCVDAILPFMRVGLGVSAERFGESRRPKKLVEYTFSKFQDGRAIYGSALGFQSNELNQEAQPLTFIIMATHDDRWQLGRLVDQIETLGTLRLAGLHDLTRIVKANYELRSVEDDLEKIAAKLPATMKRHVGTKRSHNDVEKLKQEIEKVSVSLNEAWHKLTQVSLGEKSTSSSNPGEAASTAAPAEYIRGGLASRVERARYYRQQFTSLVASSSIDKIGEFQPYHQFVERRLGATYDFIRMVGLRQARLQTLIVSFTRQTTSSELLSLQDKITEQTEKIEQLQEGAETAFFAVLFPYYASVVAISFIQRTSTGFDFLNLKVDALIVCACLFGGICYAIWKRFQDRLKPTPLRYWAFALTLILITLSTVLLMTPTIPVQAPTSPPASVAPDDHH
jgi:hypothetical protein